MSVVRKRVLISGMVQGVFFRDSTQSKARELGLFGWVKNTPNGTVEAVFEGESDRVEDMIKWTQQGPPGANVSNVKVTPEAATAKFNGFVIRH